MMNKARKVNSFITASPANDCYQCRPARGVWLFAAMICLTLILAVWQYQRGSSRAALLQQYELAAQQAARPITQLHGQPAGQRVSLSGVPAGSVLLLQNSYQNQVAGVRVIQPLRLDDGSTLLVDRGWLADRQSAMLPPWPGGQMTARWLPLPQRFVLPGALLTTAGRTDGLDGQLLAARYPNLRPGLALLEHPLAPLQPWPVKPAWQPQRHYAYAVQWLLMSICLAICLIRYRRSHVN